MSEPLSLVVFVGKPGRRLVNSKSARGGGSLCTDSAGVMTQETVEEINNSVRAAVQVLLESEDSESHFVQLSWTFYNPLNSKNFVEVLRMALSHCPHNGVLLFDAEGSLGSIAVHIWRQETL